MQRFRDTDIICIFVRGFSSNERLGLFASFVRCVAKILNYFDIIIYLRDQVECILDNCKSCATNNLVY